MTREEAIKELELIAKVTMWNDRREAIEMAIEKLKAPPISQRSMYQLGYIQGQEGEIEAIDMAIEALKRERTDEWCTDCKEYDTEKKCCPRFNKVIREALKREPSEDEPKGDLISRADAIEAMGEEPPVWCDEDYEIAERNQWRADIEAIKSVPSADRPKGEWIVHDIVCREEICLPYECLNCGFRYSRRFNFCSNCGADMRGEDE